MESPEAKLDCQKNKNRHRAMTILEISLAPASSPPLDNNTPALLRKSHTTTARIFYKWQKSRWEKRRLWAACSDYISEPYVSKLERGIQKSVVYSYRVFCMVQVYYRHFPGDKQKFPAIPFRMTVLKLWDTVTFLSAGGTRARRITPPI